MNRHREATPNLNYLDVSSNAIQALSTLSETPYLAWIGADHNHITSLEDFLPENNVCKPVRYLSLVDNWLTDEAVCVQLPQLRTCATVNCERLCRANANYDNDAFTNQQEWDYLGLFYATREDGDGIYADWIYSGTLHPPFTGEDALDDFADWLACVPKTRVTVQIDGQGSVGGFDFDYGAHHPAADAQKLWVRDFATYAQSCTNACATNPSCDYNEITLTATPAEDWVFDHWAGDVPEEPGDLIPADLDPDLAVARKRYYNMDVNVSLEGSRFVRAVFVYRPGMDDMDLVSDLGAFLAAIGELEDAGDVWDLAFDRGGLELDANLEHVYTGDGIPDATEFALLQSVLQHPGLSYVYTGGVVGETVWNDYDTNLTLASAKLPGITPPAGISADAVRRAMAAYMTFGSYASVCMVCAEVKSHFGVELEPVDFARSSSRWLAAGQDADQDGATNAEEWAAAASQSWESSEDLLAAFGNAASDAGQDNGVSGDDGDCSDPRDAYIPKVWVSVTSDSGVTASAGVAGCSKTYPIPGPVPVGRTIKVDAGGLFYSWSIPGTLAHQSPAPHTSFVLLSGKSPLAIHANAIGWSSITVQKQAESTVAAPEAFGKWSKLVQVQDNGSTIRVVGPDTAFVKLTYTPHEDYEARGWGIPYSEEGILVDPVTYANEISVFLGDGMGDSRISPNAEWRPQEKDLRGYSVQAAGSGEVGAMGLTSTASGQFYVNGGVSFDDPGRAYVTGIAYPGNQFAYWSLTDSQGTTVEGTGLFGLCWAGGPFMSATAKFVPLTHLTLKVSSDGGEPPQYVGTVTANPAKAGYGRSFMKDSAGHMTKVTGEVVHLHASPLCGYTFSHWKGTGKAWLGKIETPSDSAAHDLKDTDYFRGRSTITIRMDTDRELEAVFCECIHKGSPRNGSLSGDVTRPFMPHTVNNGGTSPSKQHACLYYLHKKVAKLAVDFYSNYNADLELNDFSKAGGGYLYPHKSHQNGLNADINYNNITDIQLKGLLSLISTMADLEDFRMPKNIYDRLYPNGENSGAPSNLNDDPKEGCIHIGLKDPDGTNN